MRPEQFTLWLQGFLDGKGENLTAADFEKVREKLSVTIGGQVASRLMGLDNPFDSSEVEKSCAGQTAGRISAAPYKSQHPPVAIAVDNTKLPF